MFQQGIDVLQLEQAFIVSPFARVAFESVTICLLSSICVVAGIRNGNFYLPPERTEMSYRARLTA